MINQTKYHSINQNDCVVEHWEKLLSIMNIVDYQLGSNYVSMPCPIHGGDNPTGLGLCIEDHTYRGKWRCFTHHCEETFGGTISGFIHGILSHQKLNWSLDGDKTVDKNEVEHILKSLPKSSPKNNHHTQGLFQPHICSVNTAKNCINISRSLLRQILQIPAKYYINRGYKREILDKYDIGLCTNNQKPMFNRVVVPIYDENNKYIIGCTGRSIFEKCNKCNTYHNSIENCPTSDKKRYYSKWKHSFGFDSGNSVYNYGKAKKHIQKSKSVILVESPGNVWKLEQNGVHNSVGLFGTKLNFGQEQVLYNCNVLDVYLLLDNDDAGYKATQKIVKQLQKLFHVFIVKMDDKYNDVAKMPDELIKQDIIPQLN